MPVIQYKCPNCGGSLEFSAEKQSFNCEYCLSTFNEEQLKKAFPENENNPLSEQEKEDKSDFTDHSSLYSCPSCGAEIISEDTTAATFCYYCHGPVILSGRLSGEFRPSKVIPFKKTREQVIDGFKSWCKKKWFLPDAFRNDSQVEKMTSVYLPFWLADCKLDAHVYGIGKNIRTWTTGDMRYTHTKEYGLTRSAYIDFCKIPADGSSKTDDRLMEAIEPFDYEPFDYSELKDFSMSYLSGYLAEKYDVDNMAIFPRIKERAGDASIDMLKSTMKGYTTLNITSAKADVIKTDWHYMLLPVWLMTYNFKGKQYFFSMN